MIRLHVLGSLALSRDDGTEIVSVLAQPKRVALLAYLAASPSAYHRRDLLLAMLWPEQDDARGREALNTAISFLRRELGRNAILSRGLDEIGLNAEMCWSDVGAFRAAFDGRSFAEALALYRGNLLEGFHANNAGPFEEWLERTRAQLRFDAARAARAAAEERERSQHHTTAISCARRALELSDDDERVLRQLLELLERLGDRVGALVAYEAFERRLAEEFSAEPSIETRALIGRIRAGRTIVAGESEISNGASSAKPTPWVIEREIGRGGMATVYLARDTAHDRPVALKMMRPELMSSGAERFLREIRITARLAHPRILPLIDSGVREGAPYLVTPYIEGESLRDRLGRVGTISTRETLDLATQIAEALDYAHRSGVIHCDIKPENILLADEQVVVADFGVARAVGADAGIREVVGSHGYMSPEQRDPNGVLDARSDLYSLGCVVTEAICAAVPRDARHADEMLENHDAPESFAGLSATVSPTKRSAVRPPQLSYWIACEWSLARWTPS
jgi:serine/threonine-protein kinase